MTKRFSHFVVVTDHQTGRMWVDIDTTVAKFNDGYIWNEETSEWEMPEVGTPIDEKDTELLTKLEQLLNVGNIQTF